MGVANVSRMDARLLLPSIEYIFCAGADITIGEFVIADNNGRAIPSKNKGDYP